MPTEPCWEYTSCMYHCNCCGGLGLPCISLRSSKPACAQCLLSKTQITLQATNQHIKGCWGGGTLLWVKLWLMHLEFDLRAHLILLLDLNITITSSHPQQFSDCQSLRTSGALMKVPAFFLYWSPNTVCKSAVILLWGVSAVKALITWLSLAVRPVVVLWSDPSPTKQTLQQGTISVPLKAFDLGRHFMFSQSLLIICQALCKGCNKHV